VRNLVHALADADQVNEYILVHAAPNPGREVAAPRAVNFATRRLRFRERILNVAWHRLGLPIPIDLATGLVDIFHSPDFVLPPVRKAKRLITVHDLAFLVHPECADEQLRLFLERAVPRAAQQADYVLADSEQTRNDVICLLDVKPERVFVVPGGVDHSVFHPAGEEAIARARATFKLDRPYLLAVGVIEPRKNYPRLIEAYNRFRVRTGLPHELVIAGGVGWLSEETFRVAAASAFPKDIRFLGFVRDEDLVALYSGASTFAYPSLYEGFGLPVLEAMACATPVVCSNASSLPELTGDAALLVTPTDVDEIADALETACCNQAMRQRLIERGLTRAESYSWRRSAELLLDVYAHVVGSN
jgi:glycosyltransferase involved in cell wall biosynthesis